MYWQSTTLEGGHLSITEDFGHRIDPHRRELLAHCYRMVGSVHDAEDLVQETMLRAWRARDSYDERLASVRTWLYRIATNACLTSLQSKRRRPLPSGLAGPSDDPDQPLTPNREVSWLQPFPDALLGDRDDPATVLAARGSMRLALIAALQFLPARVALRELLTDDVVLEMPPMTNWYAGREDYSAFITRVFRLRGTDWRMLAARANGQPALAAYLRGVDGTFRLHTLQVFTVTGAGISRNTVFQDPEVFESFGLAAALPADGALKGR